MSDAGPTSSETTDSPEERARRRRLAEIFGDDLDDYAGDDAVDPADRGHDRTADWLRREVPPHHGS